MNLSQAGRNIINTIFKDFIAYADQLLRVYEWKVPGWLSMFITPRTLQWLFSYVSSGIDMIPDEVCISIAKRVHDQMESIDDAYVRSVLRGKPDRSLAAVEESMGTMVWDDI
jgi:hypothetical protein